MNIMVWAKGLIAAVIGGVANSVTLMIADPLNFNLGEGINKLLTVAATSAIIAAAAYLAKSPIPEVQ
jgi:hypothetical protein